MSLMTTWTTTHVPARRYPADRLDGSRVPRPAWDCANCSLLNTGARKRCSDCGTSRD